MKYDNTKWILILLITLFFGGASIVDAKTSYTISSPYLTENSGKVILQWNQTQPVLTTVYKLSYTRKLANNCQGVETFGANCVVLWQKRATIGTIRVVDKGYKRGDEYYIQQNVYQTHNGGYGPFIPR